VSQLEKYDRLSAAFSNHEYGDPAAYHRRRAEVVAEIEPRLEPGDRVLDLACGDAGMAVPLLERGFEYVGVDASTGMVTAARERVGGRVPIEHGTIDGYGPPEPVAATICFRAFYYAVDRRAFFAHVATYTRKKLVFDVSPRRFSVDEVLADLRAAGYERVVLQPFFLPQRHRVPRVLAAVLRRVERTPRLARAVLRVHGILIVSASASSARTQS